MKHAPTSAALVIGALLTSWALVLNHVDQFQAGLAWNFISGEVRLQEPGFHLTAPWTLVSDIDTRPQRVCITTASHAAFNCRLVQFDLSSWREFVATEGWHYYWLDNRLSYNGGYREEYRGFRDILRGYAFSARHYPFVRVLESFDR